MLTAYNQFLINLDEVKKTRLIVISLNVPSSSIVDTSSILRSCIVLSVSALDHLIHELTLVGMKEIFQGRRYSTSRYNKQNISLGLYHLINGTTNIGLFENEIRKNLGWQTFQRPEKIKEAISIFSNIQLWQQVAISLGQSEQNLKNQLDLIIDRRNMIAHESDIEPIYKTRRPINDLDVINTIEFIESVGTSIYRLVR